MIEFINVYVKTLYDLSSDVRKNRSLILPEFIVEPHHIKCTISKSHGASVEFTEKADDWSQLHMNIVDIPIEQAVFESESTGTPFFSNIGVGNMIKGMNLITKEYYDINKESIEILARGLPNEIKSNTNYFVEIKSGDVRLIDVGLAWRKDGVDKLRKISNLWLLADDSVLYLTTEKAKERALRDYNEIISDSVKDTPLQILGGMIWQYDLLLKDPNLKEETMQEFLERNFVLLDATFVNPLFTKGQLRAMHMPEADFMVKRTDDTYLLIEIENPRDNLFRIDGLPSRELNDAIHQIQRYISEVRNNVLLHSKNFPDMTAEKVTGLLIIGRSSRLSPKETKLLEQIQKGGWTRGFKIITYDELFNETRTVIQNLASRIGWRA